MNQQQRFRLSESWRGGIYPEITNVIQAPRQRSVRWRVLQSRIVRRILRIALVSAALLAAGYGQTSAVRSRTEFEAASIRVNPPRVGFHFASDSGSGGPGSTNPGMFRCSSCTLATLIAKAFDLRNYQFPGRTSLGDNTFEVMARVPAGATEEDFLAMLQNLLKDRFGLAYHYKEKNMRGYHLVTARNGSKLKESTENAKPPAADDPIHQRQSGNAYQHGSGPGEGHTRNGLVILNGSATFRGDHQTTVDLARLLSDQLSLPVEDRTGLPGKYDISLSWSGNIAHSGNHAEGAWNGGGASGAGHGDHGGSGAPGGSTGSGSRQAGDASGPTLFEAVQSQLGLKLVSSEQTVARIFVIDHLEQLPTAN